jgi:hypothetical protein
MRAIEYGIKNFGGFSYTGNNNNIYVFNDEKIVERESGANTSFVPYLIQLTPVNNGQFEIADNPKRIHPDELYYLQESRIVKITELDNVAINFAGTDTFYRTVYKIEEEFYVYEVTNLEEVVVPTKPNKPIREVRDPVNIVNNILKDKMSVVMFISSDGARITRAYQAVTDLYDHEMVLFIEVNDDGNYFGSVIKVKSGQRINSIGVFPLQNISKLVEIYNTQIDPGSFRKILEDHVRNKDGERMYLVKKVIYGIFDRVVVFTAGLPLLAISKLSFEISDFLGGLHFKENSWRYYDDKGTPSKETDLFLPGIHLFKALSAATDETQKTSLNHEDLVKKSISRLEDLKLILTAKFNQKKSSEGGDFFFKDSFSKVIQQIFKIIDHTIIFVKKMFKKLSIFTIDGFIVVNALIVGIINGFIEAVKGLFELVHHIAEAVLNMMDKGRDVAMNFGSYVVFFIELIENKIETFLNLFSLKNFNLLFDFFQEIFPILITLGSNAIDSIKKNIEDISIPNIDAAAYYTGYVIGMIVELILETVVTAGGSAAGRGIKTFVEALKKMNSNFLKLGGKAAGTSRELIDVLLDLFNTLRKNSKNLKPLLDDILDFIRDLAGLVTRQVTDFFATFGLTLKKVRQPALYSGIPIPVGDDLYALLKNGKEIFRGTKKEIDELAEKLRKMSDEDAKKYVDELVKGNKLKLAKQMWDNFSYEDLLKGKKPCFLAGTLVKTVNGLIAIDKIETGTKVLSYNFETQQTEYQPVLQTFSNYAEKYVELHTENDVLKVTGAHLFYVSNENKWIAASQLSLDMQLQDDQQNLIAIKKLDIIKAVVPTYNLEVAQNHNYYVGETQHILTHNDGKKLKFTNTEMFDFEFYEYLDYNNKPTYVGQTTQKLDTRANQHRIEFEKKPTKKEFIKVSKKLPQEIIINGKPGPYKMTPFEAAITEMYELNTRGGKKKIDGSGLFNKKNPVSKKTFERIKRDFPNFNPCRFYY